ncbi:MAG: zinc metallopeptidase, partial [Chloroflexota bacterium]
MAIILLIAILLAALFLPGFWVRRVMARYSEPADRYSVTGGDAARRLLDLNGLKDVGVEATEAGDHYSPMEKVVRLSGANFSGRSLTAVTIAAHEVGHAVQDASGYPALRLRTQLVRWVGPIQKVGAVLLMGATVIVEV